MTSIPSTPHNQKRSEGPVPSLVSTLRSDNRDQLISVLTLDPLSNSLPTSTIQDTNNDIDTDTTNNNNNPPSEVSHKNRLVFASESLRSLLLYHTLPDPATRSATLLKPKPKTSTRKTIFTRQEEALGLMPNNALGIVGTRILLDNDSLLHDNNTENDAPGLMGTGNGTETIYNPSTNKSVFSSSMDDPRDDIDGASVIIYFIHPIPQHIQIVSKVIRETSSAQKISRNHNPFEHQSSTTISGTPSTRITKHRIVFLPRITALSKRILTDEQITRRKDVAIHSLDINLIPMEDDVLTCLEMESTMAECYVNNTPSEHITHVAQSLRKVQDICGTIPRVQSYGKAGEMVLERMMALRLEEYDPYDMESAEDGQEANPEIKAAIILDRMVDLVTPLVTPLTYEGLLDDLVKIDAG